MPSLTRLFVILVALSCASLKEVHASFYLNPHDSFAYQTELGPLIRRAESSASTPPPPNLKLQQACKERCSHLQLESLDWSNDGFLDDCVRHCINYPKSYGTGYHQHLLLQQHTVALPPPPQEDRPPMPGSPVEYGASSSESEQAEFEKWCQAHNPGWQGGRSSQYQACLKFMREEWKRAVRCEGLRPPSDPTEHVMEAVSPEYVSWCIDCSITNGKARNNVALGYIKNPGTEIIWKERGGIASLPLVSMGDVTKCFDHCQKKKQAISGCVRTCLVKAHVTASSSHDDNLHPLLPRPRPPSPAKGGALPPPLSRSEQAEFEKWCEYSTQNANAYQSCLENRRENWERGKRCTGPQLPLDSTQHLKTVSLEYISWCIDCSITDVRVRASVALEHIKNPEMEGIWEKQGGVASSPLFLVSVVTKCFNHCNRSKMGISKCVKTCLETLEAEKKGLDAWSMAKKETPSGRAPTRPA